VVLHGIAELAEQVRLVEAGVISEVEGARRAANPEWVWDDEQFEVAAQYIDQARCAGEMKNARIFSSLLMHTVELRKPASWRIAALAFVQVATEVVAEECDGALYQRASKFAHMLLVGADANSLLAVAHFNLEPFAVDPIRGTFHERKRAFEARKRRRPFEPSADLELLPFEKALTGAQVLFARLAAMTTGVARGVALVEQAFAAYSLSQSGVDPDSLDPVSPEDKESQISLCAEGWPLLGGEPLGTARACWLLSKHDAWHRVRGRQLILPNAVELIYAYGPRRASAIIAIGASLFGRDNRDVARSRCEHAAASLPAEGFESQRAWLTGILAHLLPDDPTDCASAAFRGAVSSVAERGRAAGWTHAQMGDAMLHALAHDVDGAPADPDLISAQVRDTTMYYRVLAAREQRLASDLMAENKYGEAAVRFIRAAGLHTEGGFPQDAEVCLHATAVMAESSPEAACAAVEKLTQMADAFVGSLGQIGAAALDEIYTHCFCQLNQEGPRLPLGALMQLAKGRAFAQLQAFGSLDPPVGYVPLEIDALAAAEAAAQTLPPYARELSPEEHEFMLTTPQLFDGHSFLGAYLTDAEAQGGSNPTEELANLRRVYQRLDKGRLQYSPSRMMVFRERPTGVVRLKVITGIAPIFTDDTVRAGLPEDAVLVSIYERSVLIPARPGTIYMFATAEATWSVTVGFRGDQARNQLEMGVKFPDGDSSRVIRFTPAAYRTANVRRLLLEDPLSRVVSREADAVLANEADMYEALLDQLARLRESGKRRLLIWPHGAYYFYPFHLLPTGGGRILADDWTVAFVPSLRSVVDAPRGDGRSSVLAIASSTGGTRFGLPAEPDVVRQAQAVAEAFGATPLVDSGEATTERLLAEVGQARFVHIAAHGAHYSPAPMFDAIYLADGPLYAHQVLQMDLRGVELVTLSACESGLLRLDESDNLHGMAAAFLRAGASAVVGSMWPVRASVAGTFFAEFYNRLASGRSRLDAFRHAQIMTRRSFPQYRDWAAFSMLGGCRGG
jgi:CHAT domain-containing protein